MGPATRIYTTQLNGQDVKFEAWGNIGGAWESDQLIDEQLKQFPTWPKGMPLNYPTAFTAADEKKPTNINITVDGAPMENVILGFVLVAPHPPQELSQWRGTLNEGTWIPVIDSEGYFRQDVLDDGRTLLLGEAATQLILGFYRLSKPVSKISITTAGSINLPVYPQMQMMVYQGKQC